MASLLDEAFERIPRHLFTADEKVLFEQLEHFPEKMNYYSKVDDEEPLQGDGWKGIRFVALETGEAKEISVAILSNSCDIAANNKRIRPPKISIIPLISVARFEQLLANSGVKIDTIADYVNAIRNQEVTNAFFFPQGAGINEDKVAFLDDIQSPNLATVWSNQNKQRLFTLSQAGFWMFLYKIGIHFCRPRDGIARG